MTLDKEDVEAIANRVVEKMRAGQGASARETISVEQAMVELNYTNRAAFLRAVRVHRIPIVEINSRNFVFDAEALRAWKERKTFNAA